MAGTLPHSRHYLHLRHEMLEQGRQVFMLYLANGLACVILVLFGVLAAVSGQLALAAFTFTHAAVCAGTIALLKWSGKLELANRCFVCGVLMLFTYLLATGGMHNTGPLWAYPIVIAAIFLQGAQRGMLLAAGMVCIAIAVFSGALSSALALASPASYTPDFKLRFMITFVALAGFTALHEYARNRGQKQLLQISAQLDELSHTDQLTALPNRRYMLARLETENTRYLRQRRVYSLLYADVDHFKLINDRCGHHTGDLALRAIAQTLRGNLRQQDEVGRWGGEEFLILLPETDQSQAIEAAEKLRAAVAAIAFMHDGQPLDLTISFGVHTVNCHGKTDAFIQCADEKLYLAKKSGRNRTVAHLDGAAPDSAESAPEPCLVMAA